MHILPNQNQSSPGERIKWSFSPTLDCVPDSRDTHQPSREDQIDQSQFSDSPCQIFEYESLPSRLHILWLHQFCVQVRGMQVTSPLVALALRNSLP